MTRTQNAAIQAAVAAAVSALATNGTGRKAKGRGRRGQGRVKQDDATLQANAARNAKEAEDMFAKLGFKDNRSHETILTYGKVKDGVASGWLGKGRIVKAGEKSHKHPTANYPLFHIDQTRELTDEDRTKLGIVSPTVQ